MSRCLEPNPVRAEAATAQRKRAGRGDRDLTPGSEQRVGGTNCSRWVVQMLDRMIEHDRVERGALEGRRHQLRRAETHITALLSGGSHGSEIGLHAHGLPAQS